MKNLKNTFTLIALLIVFIANAQTANKARGAAELSATKNVNGHLVDPSTNCVLRYYYFPNLEAYYDTQKNIYYYTEDGKWLTADEIPAGYRGYSLYNKVNIIIKDYDDDDVTQFANVHKKKYPYITKSNLKKMTASID